MPVRLAQVVAAAIELYALAGVFFASAFLPRAIVRMDGGLRGAPLALRLVLFPGVAALWPLFARRWFAGSAAPVERTPHRSAATARQS